MNVFISRQGGEDKNDCLGDIPAAKQMGDLETGGKHEQRRAGKKYKHRIASLRVKAEGAGKQKIKRQRGQRAGDHVRIDCHQVGAKKFAEENAQWRICRLKKQIIEDSKK